MRQPTPDSVAYNWYRAALSGEAPPTHDGEPQAGYFKRRMVKNGPWVPVRIYLDANIDPETGELLSDERLVAISGKRPADPIWLWTHVRPITEDEYDQLYVDQDKSMMRATEASIDLSQNPILPRRKTRD